MRKILAVFVLALALSGCAQVRHNHKYWMELKNGQQITVFASVCAPEGRWSQSGDVIDCYDYTVSEQYPVSVFSVTQFIALGEVK